MAFSWGSREQYGVRHGNLDGLPGAISQFPNEIPRDFCVQRASEAARAVNPAHVGRQGIAFQAPSFRRNTWQRHNERRNL